MALPLSNSCDGGAAAATVTTLNSGGAAGNAFDAVTIGTSEADTYDATNTAHGTGLALKITTFTTVAANYVAWTTSLGTLSTGQTLSGRLYYVPPAAIPGSTVRILHILNGTTVLCGIGHASGTGDIGIRATTDAANGTATGTALVAGTLYRIEFVFTGVGTASGGTGQVKVFTGDSASQVGITATTSAPSFGTLAPNAIRYGICTANGVVSSNSWFDGLLVDATGVFPGPESAASTPAPLTAPLSNTTRLSVLRGMRNLAGMRAFQPRALTYRTDSQSGSLIFGGSAVESSGVPAAPAAPAPSNVTRLSVLRGVRNLAGMRRYQPAALKYTVDAQSGTLIFGGSAAEGVVLPAAKQPVSDTTQLSVLRGVRNPVGMRRYQPAALRYTADAQSGTLLFGGSAAESVVVPAPPAPVSNTTRLSVLRGIRSPQGMRAFQPAALSYRVDAQSGTLLFAGSGSEAFTPPPAPAPLSNVTQLSVSRGIRNLAGMRRYQPAQVTYRTDSQTGNLLFGGSAVSSTGRTDAQTGNLVFGGSALEYWTPPTPVPPLSNVTQLSVTRGVRNAVGMRRYQPAALFYRLDAQSGNLIFGGSGTDTYLPPGGTPSPFTPTVGIAAFIKVGTN